MNKLCTWGITQSSRLKYLHTNIETGTPSHGGFTFYEVMEVLQGVANKGEVVGIDLCEVAPDYDLSSTTSILATQFLSSLYKLVWTLIMKGLFLIEFIAILRAR